MRIAVRFSEYAMTGAFFVLSQALVVLLYVEDAFRSTAYGNAVAVLQAVPEPFQQSAATLMATVGVLLIFVAGVLLDLLPSLLFYPEIVVFHRNVKRHRLWLMRALRGCGHSIVTDFENLAEQVSDRYVAIGLRDLRSLRCYSAWRRAQDFLFCYIESRGLKSEELSNHLHLWRTSRALGNVMMLLAIEVLFLKHGGLALYLHLSLWLAALVVSLSSYHRLCLSLFNLACALTVDGGDEGSHGLVGAAR